MTTQLNSTAAASTPAVMGWREWLALPALGISEVKVKVDTGARSSALHAFDIHRFDRSGVAMVRFKVHPLQRNTSHTITAETPVLDERWVRSSSGQSQSRPVIQTLVKVGEQSWPIELTLTNRDAMGFRMLLGREAVRHRFLVDPGRSYLLGGGCTH
ncbi:ATP-dependent zinc protease [Leptolyngbya sp. PCC 6406]|uniref:ATP-dependent zinc protease family protein n=1 Tax=Leptolyngbya sp. PCC 6406 TaxID=1173264 RepID=UPI0002ABBBA4|nr:RimK/LysX family protein [Leptolyngbya sp. PCC 6406]